MRARFVLMGVLVGCGGPSQEAAPAATPKPEVAVAPATAPAPVPAKPAEPPRPPEGDDITITSTSPEAVAEFVKARDAADSQRSADAVPHLQKALELDPGFAQATLYLSLYTTGKAGETLTHHAVDLAKSLPEAERLYVEAQAALALNDATRSRELYRKVAALKPRCVRVQIEISSFAFNDETWPELIDASKKIIAIDPKNLRAYNNLVYALSNAGRGDEAIAAAKKAIELAPDEPNPYDTLGEVALYAGRLDEAEAGFRQAAQKSPAFTPAFLGIAAVLALKGDWKAAHAALHEGHEHAARPFDARSTLYFEAWLLGAQGKIPEMLKIYDQMAKDAKKAEVDSDDAFIAVNRGYMLAMVGQPGPALKALTAAAAVAKAAALSTETMHQWLLIDNQARLLVLAKQKKRAEMEKVYAGFETEMKTVPVERFNQSNLDANQGLVALTKGDAKGAVAAMTRCAQTDFACHFWLVSAMRAAGDKAGAAAALAKLKAAPRRFGEFVFYWATTK